MAKTPSPKVVATYVLRDALEEVHKLTTEDLSSLMNSRISEAKREKVFEQVAKIASKFRQRLEKTIGKFENPAPKKPKE